LLRHGQKIEIQQRPRAESDIAVAAASILAREAFINWLDREGKKLGVRLERGVSPAVKTAGEKIVKEKGPEILRQVAKVHFRTAHAVAPEHFAEPPPRENWRK
jgi:ribonuclease HIII